MGKGEEERALFVEDEVALIGLPGQPFDVVRYEVRKTDKLGRVRLESNHVYSVAPEMALTEVVCALRAREVSIADADGALVVTHPRAYGSAPHRHLGSGKPAGPACQEARRVGQQPGQGRPPG